LFTITVAWIPISFGTSFSGYRDFIFHCYLSVSLWMQDSDECLCVLCVTRLSDYISWAMERNCSSNTFLMSGNMLFLEQFMCISSFLFICFKVQTYRIVPSFHHLYLKMKMLLNILHSLKGLGPSSTALDYSVLLVIWVWLILFADYLYMILSLICLVFYS
jgi:hypothetical protein